MYKFTNGIVVYDKDTRDNYIKAGMTLIEENKDEGKDAKSDSKEEIKSSGHERFGEAGVRNMALGKHKLSSKVNKKVGK